MPTEHDNDDIGCNYDEYDDYHKGYTQEEINDYLQDKCTEVELEIEALKYQIKKLENANKTTYYDTFYHALGTCKDLMLVYILYVMLT